MRPSRGTRPSWCAWDGALEIASAARAHPSAPPVLHLRPSDAHPAAPGADLSVGKPVGYLEYLDVVGGAAATLLIG